ncbi:MAG: hypothetical protein ACJA0M_001384 [Chitinophagales bacterium]|jgi:hypothetical protein
MYNLSKITSLCVILFLPLAALADCFDTIKETTPDSQLIDNGDGTIFDSATGLMWKKCAEGLSGADCNIGVAEGFTWDDALLQAAIVNASGGIAGYENWRLPNIKELVSIVEEACSPNINQNRFSNAPLSYWSSTPAFHNSPLPNTATAWSVDLYSGGDVGSNSYKTNLSPVRLVRGP